MAANSSGPSPPSSPSASRSSRRRASPPTHPVHIVWQGAACARMLGRSSAASRRAVRPALPQLTMPRCACPPCRSTFPDHAALLVPAVQIDLSYNQLSGEVPKEIALIKKLEQLKIEVNQVEGGIPEELGNLDRLVSPRCRCCFHRCRCCCGPIHPARAG